MVADRSQEDAVKLGAVSSSRWQAYTWKNELAEQRRRILLHLSEAIDEIETSHNPYHMLDRAIGISALCMRRLIECRLLTDGFMQRPILVHEILVKADAKLQEPFACSTMGHVHSDYDLRTRSAVRREPKFIADKMLHARIIGVLTESAYLPSGLLLASDFQRNASLFHFTPAELGNVLDAFLNDVVQTSIDGFIDDNGHMFKTKTNPRAIRM